MSYFLPIVAWHFCSVLSYIDHEYLLRYHHLNHHAIFGAGYRSGAVSIMQTLLRKYGDRL